MKDDKVTSRDFMSPVKPTWCPGCGNFGIFNAIKSSLSEKGWGPEDIVLVFDIGCNGNGADKIKAYGFKGLHGRAIPLAAGIKLANKNLPVIAMGGDGGTLDEGMQHFIHAFRNNYNITFLMHNNENFGLTTGQETPTTPKGQPMVVSPWGVVSDRLNPLQLALSAGAMHMSSTWTGNIKHLRQMITEALDYQGFSFVNIYQHCPTYNKFEDMEWLKERVYDLAEADHDVTDFYSAMKHAEYSIEKRAIGTIYKIDEAKNYLDRVPYRKEFETTLVDEVTKIDVDPLLNEFK